MPHAIGVLLAGGAGSRLGGDKALVELDGRPLAAYAHDVLRQVTDSQVFVAKADTRLPDLGIETWIEPDAPRHPLAGIAHALRTAAGAAILVLAADMPLIARDDMELINQPADRARVPRAAGRLQPLCARYESAALARLENFGDGDRLTERVLALDPAIVEFEHAFFNVNTPAQLAEAGRLLDRGLAAD